MEFEELPKDFIAKILSHNTPGDVSRLSLVSRHLRSVADSDAVWSRFLPPDVNSIISRSDSESDALANSPSKKALYLALSDHPIIIDHGTKSFQLDRKSGIICYMLAPRALYIVWGDTPQYWNWNAMSESRFPEVAELIDVCWLEIRGTINTNALTPNTQYAAYLVFKMINDYGFDDYPVKLSVDIRGGESSTKDVCLVPDIEDGEEDERVVGLERPRARSDGWLEIEMGEFSNSGSQDQQVQLGVVETESGDWKSGLFIQGIEVRPKGDN